MMRLVDADKVITSLTEICERRRNLPRFIEGVQRAIEMIKDATPVDAVKVEHGRWISDEGDVLFHCSECETQISTSWDYDDLHWNYCPNCGAKMDGERR